jgi:hypothetical protein
MAMGMRLFPGSALLLAVASFSLSLTARAEDNHPSSPPLPEAPATRDDSDAAGPATTQPATGSARLVPLRDAPGSLSSPPEVPDVFAVRRLTLEAHVGIATPVGEFGFVSEYSPHPIIGLGIGVGLGLRFGADIGSNNSNGFRGALLARFRPLRGKKNALVLGAAYSFGGFQRFEVHIGDTDPPPIADRANWAHWAQFDIGWERRAPTGFLFRMSAGGAILLNPGDIECKPSEAASCIPLKSQSLFTVDFALGYAGPV